MLPKTASDTAMITIGEDGVLIMAHSCATICKSNSVAGSRDSGGGCAEDRSARHAHAANTVLVETDMALP
jgi:hypothetical protein